MAEIKELQAKEKVAATVPPEQTKPGPVFTPNVDILETEKEIIMLADIPGVKSADLVIDLRDDRVDLELLKPVVQRCNLMITNDTGPRHYAVAFDIPVVVIMGPTDPRYTDANLEKTIIVRRDLECAPCHHKECALHHSCMTEILPEEVMQAAEQLLQEHA
jgi:heptosyltransferase-2